MLADTRVGERGGFYEVKIKNKKTRALLGCLMQAIPSIPSPERLVSKKGKKREVELPSTASEVCYITMNSPT